MKSLLNAFASPVKKHAVASAEYNYEGRIIKGYLLREAYSTQMSETMTKGNGHPAMLVDVRSIAVISKEINVDEFEEEFANVMENLDYNLKANLEEYMDK